MTSLKSFFLQLPESLKCCFLMQIKAIVLSSSAGLTNLTKKTKAKSILVVVVKYRNCAIVLLFA